MNRRLLAVTLAAACLVAGVLVTPGVAGTRSNGDAALRALYNSPRFAQLSGAAQMALARKFGPRIGAAVPSGRLGASPLAGNGIAVNNNAADTTSQDTQSETTLLVFGSTVLSGFNDSGSCLPSCGTGSADHFTGYARSKNGGTSFKDLGALPNSTPGDAGDPTVARDNVTGTIYFSALSFNSFNELETFRSSDGGKTFGAPVNSAPGWSAGNEQDKEWLTVDNFAGAGQGTVYESWTRFGSTVDIRITHSTDGGTTWLPSQGVKIAGGVVQGSYVVVAPDHSVSVFWLSGSSPQKLMVRRSTDGGTTFAPPVTVATLGVTGVNGDLGLGGGFRTNAFPHVAVNPKNGNMYVVYNDNPAGSDKGDIEFTESTNGGATWSSPVKVNDDATTRDQWQPAITVTPNGKALFIGWYDRRRDAANSLIDWFGTIGDIAGTTVTFQPNIQITTTNFPVVIGQDPIINTTYMGDYDTAQADKNFFYTTWGDNLLPSAAHAHQPDVRFAKIPVS